MTNTEQPTAAEVLQTKVQEHDELFKQALDDYVKNHEKKLAAPTTHETLAA